MKIVDMKMPQDGRGKKNPKQKNKEHIDAFCNLGEYQCLVLPNNKEGMNIYASIRRYCIKYTTFHGKYRKINENEIGIWRVET